MVWVGDEPQGRGKKARRERNRELRPREVNQIAQDHTDDTQQS